MLEILVLAALILIYFVSRFYSILAMPIFTDEAIYIRWAQIAKQDANWRFISLTDGKQPMFIWLMILTLHLIQEPLLAGRLVSVGAGFLTLIGMYFLGREIFKSNKVGLVSSALYTIFPMALVYDRMALYDSLVGTFAVWALFLTVILVRKIRLDVALILGMVVGGGALTKTNAFFSIYLLPFSLLLLNWVKNGIKNRLLKWAGLCLVSVTLAYGFYSILRLSPFFHIIAEKNAIFVYPFRDWLDHPFNFFINNYWSFWDWIVRYLTWPLIALVLLSFVINKSFLREKIVLLLWFILPLAALGLFGKTLYPRFIFFMMLSLLPLVAFSLVNIYSIFKKNYLFIIFCFLVFMLAIKIDYLILTDFAKSNIPFSDVSQYQIDWPSGGGINASVKFFENETKKGKIYIATQGTFGLLPFAYEIYLVKNPNVTIEGFWPLDNGIPQKVLDKSKKMPTFFVFYQSCLQCRIAGEAPQEWKQMKLVYQFNKEHGRSYLSVYRVKQ